VGRYSGFHPLNIASSSSATPGYLALKVFNPPGTIRASLKFCRWELQGIELVLYDSALIQVSSETHCSFGDDRLLFSTVTSPVLKTHHPRLTRWCPSLYVRFVQIFPLLYRR
jgi:hypothetical protein